MKRGRIRPVFAWCCGTDEVFGLHGLATWYIVNCWYRESLVLEDSGEKEARRVWQEQNKRVRYVKREKGCRGQADDSGGLSTDENLRLLQR